MKEKPIDDTVMDTMALYGVNSVTLALRLLRSMILLCESMGKEQWKNTPHGETVRASVDSVARVFPTLAAFIHTLDQLPAEFKNILHTSAVVSGAYYIMLERGESKFAVMALMNGMTAEETQGIIEAVKKEAPNDFTQEAIAARERAVLENLNKAMNLASNHLAPPKQEKLS